MKLNLNNYLNLKQYIILFISKNKNFPPTKQNLVSILPRTRFDESLESWIVCLQWFHHRLLRNNNPRFRIRCHLCPGRLVWSKPCCCRCHDTETVGRVCWVMESYRRVSCPTIPHFLLLLHHHHHPCSFGTISNGYLGDWNPSWRTIGCRFR